MPSKHRSAPLAAIHETAADLHRVVGMDQKTMRNFDALCYLAKQSSQGPSSTRKLIANGSILGAGGTP